MQDNEKFMQYVTEVSATDQSIGWEQTGQSYW